MRALGARVRGITSVASLRGLDGTEADIAAVDLEGYSRQARSLTVDVALWPRATTLVMNRDVWEALAEEQRAVLEAAARVAVRAGMGESAASSAAGRSPCAISASRSRTRATSSWRRFGTQSSPSTGSSSATPTRARRSSASAR